MAASPDDNLARYHRWMAGRRRLVLRALERVPPVPDGVVIDVAGADGEFSEIVASRCPVATGRCGARLIVQDLDRDECRAARDRSHAVVHGDARRLPYADNAADVTIAFEVIEHLYKGDGVQLVDELARVTKPGGKLLLSTPNRFALESWKGVLGYLRDGTVWNARDETHVKLYSRRELLSTIRRRFDIERTYGYYLVDARQRPLFGTYTITENPLLANLCFILLVVATPSARG